jgi:hypothetical protein
MILIFSGTTESKDRISKNSDLIVDL